MEEALLAALHADPNDETTWAALTDWLEEQGQPERAELVRLNRRLRKLSFRSRTAARSRVEDRIAALLRAGVRPAVPEVVNAIGMRLALIPPGAFRMGSPGNEEGRALNEGPTHEVEITKPFYLSVHLVTQSQYEQVMGSNPAWFSATGRGREKVAGLDTADFPVETVSWADAVEFCAKLSLLPAERRAGRVYQLPTEAEWEYACRAGSLLPCAFGNELSLELANFGGESPGAVGRTSRVGSYPPNAWGLYDLHGNVYEWCSDWWEHGFSAYRSGTRQDPTGPSKGRDRVLRGGSWQRGRRECRAAFRPSVTFIRCNESNDVGFRVVCNWQAPGRK
jgi:uncharacterized protein (TIGR02996 family)